MVRQSLSIVISIVALTFFLGAWLHSGNDLLGIHEPKIIPAMIVEGLCGICLVISAYAIATHIKRAWLITVVAHIFSIMGVVLGIVALAMGRGPSTELNYIYHRVILVILISMLIILFSSKVKAALGRR